MSIGNNWDLILKDEFNKDYFNKLKNFVEDEYSNILVSLKKTRFLML